MLRKSPHIVLLLLVPLGLLWGQPPAGRILPETRINDCDFCLAAQGISPVEVGSSGLRVDLRYLHNGTVYSPYLSLEATYQYPLLHALRGQQLGEDYRILTGFQLLF